jgi:hypothetical protein
MVSLAKKFFALQTYFLPQLIYIHEIIKKFLDDSSCMHCEDRETAKLASLKTSTKMHLFLPGGPLLEHSC